MERAVEKLGKKCFHSLPLPPVKNTRTGRRNREDEETSLTKMKTQKKRNDLELLYLVLLLFRKRERVNFIKCFLYSFFVHSVFICEKQNLYNCFNINEKQKEGK